MAGKQTSSLLLLSSYGKDEDEEQVEVEGPTEAVSPEGMNTFVVPRLNIPDNESSNGFQLVGYGHDDEDEDTASSTYTVFPINIL